jgi:hypothetical protein
VTANWRAAVAGQASVAKLEGSAASERVGSTGWDLSRSLHPVAEPGESMFSSTVANVEDLLRLSQNAIVHHALTNRWLQEQGVPDMRAVWIALNYSDQRRGFLSEPPCTEPSAGWCGTRGWR